MLTCFFCKESINGTYCKNCISQNVSGMPERNGSSTQRNISGADGSIIARISGNDSAIKECLRQVLDGAVE